MAKDRDEEESRGFKVQDRRRFVDADAGGDASRAAEDVRGESPAADDASFVAADAAVAPGHGPTPDAGTDPRDGDVASGRIAGGEADFGEMTFSTFVMGLTTQALMHLGEIPDPVQQDVTHDLAAAKQMIDLLGILRDKTKGNLDAAEEQLLAEVLYDLRMRYVEVARVR
jgi:hypothetical protein